jgi:hypothetical protein
VTSSHFRNIYIWALALWVLTLALYLLGEPIGLPTIVIGILPYVLLVLSLVATAEKDWGTGFSYLRNPYYYMFMVSVMISTKMLEQQMPRLDAILITLAIIVIVGGMIFWLRKALRQRA